MLKKLQDFGPIDAALLPINGRDGARYRRNCIGNMTFQEAADLAGELHPRLVIPGHWDMFADNPGDPAPSPIIWTRNIRSGALHAAQAA
jgi:L-ascorbate metabolism protein UlaG (beta-lactamase superfamily)